MARRIDPKRFPNFLRAQRERGPFALVAPGPPTPARISKNFLIAVAGLSLGTFGAVMFGDQLLAAGKSFELPVYYRYCSDARLFGAAPILQGEPGYRPELDRDGDGIACEPYP